MCAGSDFGSTHVNKQLIFRNTDPLKMAGCWEQVAELLRSTIILDSASPPFVIHAINIPSFKCIYHAANIEFVSAHVGSLGKLLFEKACTLGVIDNSPFRNVESANSKSWNPLRNNGSDHVLEHAVAKPSLVSYTPNLFQITTPWLKR
ncbi:hypothetical protein M911_12160 [Ectothiorhodospira haloalkaliphila]|uniref:Uncharacterized protein n=1 Tax=Ectothiorhodospira haloalkaliphila TaxID=421628 RepID=W8KUR8_9GAMM|nr:hypothetical protein M911_12160 [Ectothiorhodospira haloalkaliphila]